MEQIRKTTVKQKNHIYDMLDWSLPQRTDFWKHVELSRRQSAEFSTECLMAVQFSWHMLTVSTEGNICKKTALPGVPVEAPAIWTKTPIGSCWVPNTGSASGTMTSFMTCRDSPPFAHGLTAHEVAFPAPRWTQNNTAIGRSGSEQDWCVVNGSEWPTSLRY